MVNLTEWILRILLIVWVYLWCVAFFKMIAFHLYNTHFFKSPEEKAANLAWLEKYLFLQPIMLIVLLVRLALDRRKFVKEALAAHRKTEFQEALKQRREYERRQNRPKWDDNVPLEVLYSENIVYDPETEICEDPKCE